MRDEEADDEPEGPQCPFCDGAGVIGRVWAYAPGPDPFEAPLETVLRSEPCKHCRGVGVYYSQLDPTLDEARRRASGD